MKKGDVGMARNSGVTQCLEEAEQQAETSLDVVPPSPLQIVILVPFCLFCLYLYPLSAPFLNPLSTPFPRSPRLEVMVV